MVKMTLGRIKMLDKQLKIPHEGLVKESPEGDIKPLKGADGIFRLRIGKYRILYKYVGDCLLAIKLGTRGDVYK